MAPSWKLSETTLRIALAHFQQSKMPAVIAAAEEIRHELKRAEGPPSLADYDRLKTPECDRPASMRRAPKCKPSRKRRTGGLALAAFGALFPSKSGAAKEIARARRQDIRTAVFLRAGGACECGCGEQVRDDRKGGRCFPEARGEVDHFFGRGAGRPPESEQTCWVLRPACHREKTLNRPDAATWLRKFIAHCDRRIALGGTSFCEAANAASRRLTFVETRSNLPASPRTR